MTEEQHRAEVRPIEKCCVTCKHSEPGYGNGYWCAIRTFINDDERPAELRVSPWEVCDLWEK